MAKLARLAIVAVLAISLLLAVSPQACGQQRRWRWRRVPVPRPASTAPARSDAAWRIYSPYGPLQPNYSKYYGGFHTRYFLEDWYPTGDRPVRGTAW